MLADGQVYQIRDEMRSEKQLQNYVTRFMPTDVYNSAMPPLSSEQSVTSETPVTSETTQGDETQTDKNTTSENYGGSDSGCQGDCSPPQYNGGTQTPASISIFATGTVGTTELVRHVT